MNRTPFFYLIKKLILIIVIPFFSFSQPKPKPNEFLTQEKKIIEQAIKDWRFESTAYNMLKRLLKKPRTFYYPFHTLNGASDHIGFELFRVGQLFDDSLRIFTQITYNVLGENYYCLIQYKDIKTGSIKVVDASSFKGVDLNPDTYVHSINWPDKKFYLFECPSTYYDERTPVTTTRTYYLFQQKASGLTMVKNAFEGNSWLSISEASFKPDSCLIKIKSTGRLESYSPWAKFMELKNGYYQVNLTLKFNGSRFAADSNLLRNKDSVYNSFLQKGDSMLAAGKYKQALTSYNKAGDLYPSKDAHINKANIVKDSLIAPTIHKADAYANSGDYCTALKFYARASDSNLANNYCREKREEMKRLLSRSDSLCAGKNYKFEGLITNAEKLYYHRKYFESFFLVTDIAKKYPKSSEPSRLLEDIFHSLRDTSLTRIKKLIEESITTLEQESNSFLLEGKLSKAHQVDSLATQYKIYIDYIDYCISKAPFTHLSFLSWQIKSDKMRSNKCIQLILESKCDSALLHLRAMIDFSFRKHYGYSKIFDSLKLNLARNPKYDYGSEFARYIIASEISSASSQYKQAVQYYNKALTLKNYDINWNTKKIKDWINYCEKMSS